MYPVSIHRVTPSHALPYLQPGQRKVVDCFNGYKVFRFLYSRGLFYTLYTLSSFLFFSSFPDLIRPGSDPFNKLSTCFVTFFPDSC